MASTLNTMDTVPALPGRLRRAFEVVKSTCARRSGHRRSHAALRALTDRELDDIGLRRCDVSDITTEQCYFR